MTDDDKVPPHSLAAMFGKFLADAERDAEGNRLAEIRAAAMRREIREAGQRGLSLARLREGRERLSVIVAELGIEGP